MRKNKKTFFAAARLFWPEGCLRDFFGLKKAEGLLKAKKSLKQSEGQNKPGWSKTSFFVIPKDEKCRALTLKYHFFNYRTVFPVQKVSFLAAKIPMGRKSFLSLSARKKRKRYRRKKCPIIKKCPCIGSLWSKINILNTYLAKGVKG